MDIIYLIVDNKTNLKYLGSKKNWKGEGTYWGSPNCKNKNSKKYYLQKIWKENLKNNPENFSFIILEQFKTGEIYYNELIDLELNYQKKFNILSNEEFINGGYAKRNFSGDYYTHLTEEGKKERNKKISDTLNKNIRNMLPEERIEKWSKPGIKNPNYGNKWDTEKKKKLSNKLKGKKPVQKGKSFEEFYGKEKSDELRKKISEIACNRIGEKNSFFSKSHSDETKNKLSQNRKGVKPSNIRKIEIDGVIYEGLNAASFSTGIKGTTIWYRINSENKKYEKYKYIDQ